MDPVVVESGRSGDAASQSSNLEKVPDEGQRGPEDSHAHAAGVGAQNYTEMGTCVSRASTGLSERGVGVEPLFCLGFGTAAVLAQGGGGVETLTSAMRADLGLRRSSVTSFFSC